jgi:hypothetical protein
MHKRMFIVGLLLVGAALALSACAGAQGPAGPAGPQGAVGPQGPSGPAGAPPAAADLSCTQCHNDTALITGKMTSWAGSVHATGPAFAIASSRAGCVGCHTGSGFHDRVVAGITDPTTITSADPNPSRIDCRACHQIHSTYTSADWALRTMDAVPIFAAAGSTFDGGKGNLCASCHQPLSLIPAATDGMVKVDSTHWGPHHGPQAAMLLGVGGALGVQGSPSAHYKNVQDTCVACHMGGDSAVHTFDPQLATCQTCHTDATSFDINGEQTAVKAKLDELQKALTAKGLLDKDGNPVVGSYPEAQAGALWNWIFIAHEDKSEGVHNSAYTEALLDASLAAMK